jgi:hypothetical protein
LWVGFMQRHGALGDREVDIGCRLAVGIVV